MQNRQQPAESVAPAALPDHPAAARPVIPPLRQLQAAAESAPLNAPPAMIPVPTQLPLSTMRLSTQQAAVSEKWLPHLRKAAGAQITHS